MKNDSIWRHTSASVIGSSHIASKKPCQDACRVADTGKFLICAVSDGAGSVRHSEIGAEFVVNAAVDRIISLGSVDMTLEKWGATVLDIVEGIRNGLASKAVEMGCNLRELSATFLLVVASKDFMAGAQIGDGAIVYGEDGIDRLSLLIVPKYSEYVNQTTFVTSDNCLENLQTEYLQSGSVDRLALMSDGLQMLALDMRKKPPEPSVGFFGTFFNSLSMNSPNYIADDDERLKKLSVLLASPQICSRTDDDKTLVFAAKKTFKGMSVRPPEPVRRNERLDEFDVLLAEYADRVSDIARKRLQNKSYTEHVVFETFATAWVRFNSFDKNKADFGLWLYAILKNKVREYNGY
jgi:hypothetical protein